MKTPKLLFIFLFTACSNPSVKDDTSNKLKHKLEHSYVSDTLSFEMNKNHLITKIVINDSIQANFVFDTGSHTALAFDSAFAIKNRLMKLDTTLKDIRLRNRAYVMAKDQLETQLNRFKIGRTIDTSTYSQVFNLHRIIGDKAQGIIGMKFLKKHLVEIDYLNKRMVLHQFHSFKKNEAFDTIKIYPYDKYESAFKIKVTFKPGYGLPPFSEECMLDLGVGANIIPISKRFVNKYNLLQLKNLSPIEKKNFFTKEEVTGFSSRFSSLEFGKFKMDTPRVELYTSKSGMTSFMAPLIGNYVLKSHGRIFIDFKNHGIYIPRK